MNTERIIAAACLDTKTRTIYTYPPPKRHHHILHQLLEDGDIEEGFITNTKRFLDRHHARILAIANGQVSKPMHHFELFSEDLW